MPKTSQNPIGCSGTEAPSTRITTVFFNSFHEPQCLENPGTLNPSQSPKYFLHGFEHLHLYFWPNLSKHVAKPQELEFLGHAQPKPFTLAKAW